MTATLDDLESVQPELAWTYEDSWAMDQYALALGCRESRLTVDPILWAALEQDRNEAPRPGGTNAEPKPLPKDPSVLQRRTIPSHCGHCGERMRRSNQKAEDFPGTVRHSSGDECDTCRNRRRIAERRAARIAQGLPADGRNRTPSNCKRCGHKLRPSGSTLEDYPGTLPHRKHGLCTPCDPKTVPKTTRNTHPTACSDCGAPLRPRDRTEEDFPGTVTHGGLGLCTRHYDQRRRARRKPKREAA